MKKIPDTSEADVEEEKVPSYEESIELKVPTNLLSKTVSDNEAKFRLHTLNDYLIPKPVYLQMSKFVHQMSISFEENVNETYDFAVDDTVVEYLPEAIGFSQTYGHGNRIYCYEDFGNCVSVGIPTERYNWILSEAANVTGFQIDNNSIKKVDGCTWIIADFQSCVDCYVYSPTTKDLEPLCRLSSAVTTLKSSVIGVGHFDLSIMESYDYKYFLKFKLNKFQLKDITQKSSKLKANSEVVPPEDIMALLSIQPK